LADFSYDQQSGLKADYLTELWSVESDPYNVNSTSNNDTSLDSGSFVEDDFLDENAGKGALKDIGDLVIIIEDLQGRFNVNNVQFKKQGHLSGEAQLTNMMNAVLLTGPQNAQFNSSQSVSGSIDGFEEGSANTGSSQIQLEVPLFDLAQSLKDWVDLDSDDDGSYEQKKIAYQAANQNIFDITELMAINNFDQQDYRVYDLLQPKLFEESVTSDSDESEIGYQQDLDTSFDDEETEDLQYDAEGNLLPELPSAHLHWGGVKHYLSALPWPSKINVNTAPSQVLQALFTSYQARNII